MKKIISMALSLIMAFTFVAFAPQTASAASKPGKISKITSSMEIGQESEMAYFSWSKAKNAKKYEVYKASSLNGKYTKAATTKYTFWCKKTYGLTYVKVRGVNGSKKGAFSKAVPTFLYKSKVADVTCDNEKNRTTFKLLIDNSKSSVPMYLKVELNNKIKCIYERTIKNGEIVNERTFTSSYHFEDENGNMVTDSKIEIPKKEKKYVYLSAGGAKLKTLYEAALIHQEEEYDDEDDEDDEDYDEDEDYNDDRNRETFEQCSIFSLPINYYAVDGNSVVSFKSVLEADSTSDMQDAYWFIMDYVGRDVKK